MEKYLASQVDTSLLNLYMENNADWTILIDTDWTGLEPVKGLWTLNDTDERLDITDADFVDIIHTNSGELYKLEVSFFEAIGHVDFYVNGGHKQPGCKPLDHGNHLII